MLHCVFVFLSWDDNHCHIFSLITACVHDVNQRAVLANEILFNEFLLFVQNVFSEFQKLTKKKSLGVFKAECHNVLLLAVKHDHTDKSLCRL